LGLYSNLISVAYNDWTKFREQYRYFQDVPERFKRQVCIAIISIVDCMAADNPANGFNGINLMTELREFMVYSGTQHLAPQLVVESDDDLLVKMAYGRFMQYVGQACRQQWADNNA